MKDCWHRFHLTDSIEAVREFEKLLLSNAGQALLAAILLLAAVREINTGFRLTVGLQRVHGLSLFRHKD